MVSDYSTMKTVPMWPGQFGSK